MNIAPAYFRAMVEMWIKVAYDLGIMHVKVLQVFYPDNREPRTVVVKHYNGKTVTDALPLL